MPGPATLGAGCELVAQPNVGEGAAHHHFVVAATRTIGIEVDRLDTLRTQVICRRTVRRDAAGRRDVIGGHGIAKQGQHASATDAADRLRIERHARKVGWIPHVGRVGIPGVNLTLG